MFIIPFLFCFKSQLFVVVVVKVVFIYSVLMALLTLLLSPLRRSLSLLRFPCSSCQNCSASFLGVFRGQRYWVWQRMRCAFTCCDCSSASCWSLCSCFSLTCHRLWSKTLSVMEEAQQGRQWEGRPALLISLQLRWATGLCQCRLLQTLPSHRQGVSGFSHSFTVLHG